MTNATELLSRALEAYDHKEEPYFERLHHAFEDIRTYLAAEPAIRKPMTEEEIGKEWANNDVCCYGSFSDGIRFAEKHHGIGGDDA